jgi:hypothetical protein
MAYPVIEDIINGTGTGGTISITMPDDLALNELILIYVTTYEAYVSNTLALSSGNFVKLNSVSDAYAERQTCIIYGLAKAGTANNYLTVALSSGTYGASYIVYRISGHGVYAKSDIDNDIYAHAACSYTTYETLPLAVTNPSGSLYIASVSYTYTIVDMAASLLWSDYTYRSHSQSSISTQSIGWGYSMNLIKALWNHTQTSNVRTYLSTIVRIKPGSQGIVDTDGFGLYVPRNSIGIQ